MSEYIGKNYPPSQAEFGSVCPHFQLIEVCGQFVDTTRQDLEKSRHFCGVFSKHYNTIDLLSGSEGNTHTAVASCRGIYNQFTPLIELAREEITLPSRDEVTQQMRESTDFKETERILHEYNTREARLKEQRKLLNKWRRVVFDMCVIPTTEDANIPGFRKVERPNDLSDQEVVDYASAFYNKLGELVGVKVGHYDRSKVAENCDQSPVSGDFAYHWS